MPVQGTCSRCGYISSQQLCKACVLLEGLNRGLPRVGIGKATGRNMAAIVRKYGGGRGGEGEGCVGEGVRRREGEGCVGEGGERGREGEGCVGEGVWRREGEGCVGEGGERGREGEGCVGEGRERGRREAEGGGGGGGGCNSCHCNSQAKRHTGVFERTRNDIEYF